MNDRLDVIEDRWFDEIVTSVDTRWLIDELARLRKEVVAMTKVLNANILRAAVAYVEK